MSTAPIHDRIASAKAAHPAGSARRALHVVDTCQLTSSATEVPSSASGLPGGEVTGGEVTGGALTGRFFAVPAPVERHELMNTVLHQAFRRDLRRLSEVLRRPFPAKRRDAMVDHIRFVLDQLHHHHVVEDELIWPAVLATRPDLQGLFEQMAAEHGRLGGVIERLGTATDGWAKTGDEAHRSAVRLAVVDLETALERHLQHEEADAMPIAAAALGPQQWAPIDRKLRKAGSPAAMARKMFWALDELDESRSQVVQSLLPRPLFRALRLVFCRREARRFRLLWA